MVLSMDRWVGKVAVITGAASGIGAAIAYQLVENGLIVAGIDFRPELVQKHSYQLSNKKGRLHAVKADLTNEQQVIEAFRWITENLGPVHILCNNAGYVKFGSLLDDDTATWRRVLDTNVLGLCIATREAVKSMKANNIQGHIVNTNSVHGHRVRNGKFNVYPASKFAVTALTETLRQELNSLGTRIKVTSVSPGLVETEATTLNKNLTPEWRALFEGREKLKPENIADGVVYVLSTPEHVQVHEITITPFAK